MAHNIQAATDEFISGLNDPLNRVCKAMYTSYSKGQIEMHAYAMRIGIKHDIDPRLLIDAEVKDRARRMRITAQKAVDILNKSAIIY